MLRACRPCDYSVDPAVIGRFVDVTVDLSHVEVRHEARRSRPTGGARDDHHRPGRCRRSQRKLREQFQRPARTAPSAPIPIRAWRGTWSTRTARSGSSTAGSAMVRWPDAGQGDLPDGYRDKLLDDILAELADQMTEQPAACGHPEGTALRRCHVVAVCMGGDNRYCSHCEDCRTGTVRSATPSTRSESSCSTGGSLGGWMGKRATEVSAAASDGAGLECAKVRYRAYSSSRR
ncbi:Mu transposase domain-containing protein [Terrabacter sp. AAH1]